MFGYAILDHIWDNPDFQFYAYEKNEEISISLRNEKRHPFFFQDVSLHNNIEIVQNFEEFLPDMDIILLIIPYQYLQDTLQKIRPFLKPWVIIVNLSKGVNNTTFTTVSDDLVHILKNFPYSYAIMSGGMIAGELISGAPVGADIGLSQWKDREILNGLFFRKNLHINCIDWSVKNIELYGALKNIFALYAGYLEWTWYGASTIGLYICKMLQELRIILPMLGGTTDIDLAQFSLGGDIVATCFGNSRNRYLWTLIWSGMSVVDALAQMNQERKLAEGYETLKGLRQLISKKPELIELQNIVSIFFPNESMVISENCRKK